MKQEVSIDGPWRFAAYEKGLGERQGAHQIRYDTKGWLDAQTPGEVYSDLLRAGLIADARSGADWVESKEWWYRAEFTLSFQFPRENAHLSLDNLDSTATIWLNGHRLDTTSHHPEIGDLLHPGPNTIAVRIHSTNSSSKHKAIRIALPD